MLSILLCWIYMGSIVCIMGIVVFHGFQLVTKKINAEGKNRLPSFSYVLFLGVMGCTLYAQLWGIFGGIAFEASIGLLIMVFLYIVFFPRYILKLIKYWRNDQYAFLPENWTKRGNKKGTENRIIVGLIIIAGISYALVSAGPAKLIDTPWYHAQNIRWLEEYGAVKGLGNLFPSLAYNNSQHYFDALFSMKWLWGQSLRNSGGFFGLILFIHGILRIAKWNTHKSHIADMIGIWEITYSIIVTAFYTDPYVDTLPNALVLVIFTEWIGRLEENTEGMGAMILDCLLCIFAAVCKLSVVMVVFLALHPLIILLRQKRMKEIIVYLIMGISVALPFLITNIITSGYLIYPLASLDLFPVYWKMDKEILKYTVDSMVAFARMPAATMEEALNAGISWIPIWFQNESVSHKLLYIVILMVTVYDIHRIIKQVICDKEKNRGKIQKELPMIWVRICIYLGLLYWFFSIPQVKYCWAFLILPLAIVPIYYKQKSEGNRKASEKILLISTMTVLLIYSGFYSLRTLGYMKEGILHYPIKQADYIVYNLEEIEVDNHKFYIRKEGGDLTCGYYAFPYLDNPENRNRLVLGQSLKDGISYRK